MNGALEKPNPTQTEYFKDIVATIREPLLVLDAGLRVLAANRSFYKFFKVKVGETIGQLIYDLGNRQWDIPGLRTLLETILPQKAVFNDYNVEHDFPVIGRHFMLLNARRIPAPPKEAQWILLAFEDVTERRRLERVLQASEERFRGAFETATDNMLLVDKTSGRVLNSNRAAQQTFSYSKKKLLKMNLWELDILEDHRQFEQVSEELEKVGALQILDKTVHTRGGEQFPASIYLMDRTGVIQCNIRDITTRKQMEEKLSASEDELRALFGAMTDVVIVLDGDGRYLRIAPTNPINLYRPSEEILGKTLHEVLPKEQADFMMAKIGEAIQTNQTVHGEYALSIDGEETWFEGSISRLSENSVVWVAHDITERKQAEEDARSLARFPAENPNPVLRIARDGNLLYANEAAFHQLPNWELEPGKPAPEVLRDPALEVIKTQKEKTMNIPHGERIFSISVAPAQKSEDVSLYARDVTKELRAEEKLRLLVSIIESANDAIIGQTLEGIILSWNPGAKKLYDYPASEVIGKSVSIIVPPEKADEPAEILKRIQRDERVENFETERLTKDGRRVNVSLTISPIVDEGGKVVGASTIAHDITERKKAEAELILANKELIFQNEEKEKRAAELVVANKELVYQNEEKEKRAAELIHANKELAFQEKKIRKLITELETTVEKRTAQLQETLELNQKMIETSSLGIFACRADGPCVIANPAVARISGAAVETMLQLNFRELESWKKNGLFDKAQAALVTGKEQRAESHLTTVFGKDAWLNYYFTTFTSNGELHFLMTVEDITERKQAEQALQQRTAQLEAANKELEAFSYSVSHDLRSPLRAIDGFSRILLEEYAPQLPAESRRYLDLVRSNTQKMGELVDDLLAFSRLGRQPLKKQSVSPEGIVRESLEDLRSEQEGRQVEIVISALPDCEADPALLKQVFVNLLSNALKFTRQRQVARIEIGFEEKDGKRAYYVRDNGVGFDMQYVGKLFAVFQRLHRAEDYEGTGVGLAIVQRIVSRHGGRAWAEAELDKGATFYFTLEGGESDEYN